MRQISTSILISAEPEKVWAHLTDFARYAEWNPFMIQGEGEAKPGNQLKLRFRQPSNGREMDITPVVLVSEPGQLLRWRGKLLVRGVFDGEHTFALESQSDGTTKLLHSERFTGALVPFTGSILRDTERGFDLFNKALKERVEAG